MTEVVGTPPAVENSPLRRFWFRAATLLIALTISAGVGVLALKSPLAEVSLNAVIYLAEDGTGEFFYSDEYGNFSAQSSVGFPVLRGVNNLHVPLNVQEISESFSQRLDPCECHSPFAIARLMLSTPLLSESVPSASWVLGPDIASVSTEGSVVVLRPIEGAIDPYVVLFMDIGAFK